MAPKDYLCQKLGVLAGRKRRESLSTLHVAQLARVRGQLAGVGSPTTRVCAALGLNSSRQPWLLAPLPFETSFCCDGYFEAGSHRVTLAGLEPHRYACL